MYRLEVPGKEGRVMRPKVAKSRRPEAERAGEWYLCRVCGCLPAMIIRAIRTKFQHQDLWGADVMGRTTQGRCWYAQVTAGGNEAVRVRRRKLEAIPWNQFDHVLLLQLVENPDPANARRKQFYFRVHRYDNAGEWEVDENAWPVPREWFTKLREI